VSETILFVFEGERTEVQVFRSLERHFLRNSNIKIVTFKTHIYSLYKKIKEDDLSEFLEIVDVLKEDSRTESALENLSSEDISQVFLFFDHDGHVPEARNENLLELLNHFNEETGNGKLFISYPMVEALKHVPVDRSIFQALCVDIVDEEPNTSNYKGLAHCEGDRCFRDFTNLSYESWKCLLAEHCKKANFIVYDQFVLPSTSVPTQVGIFKNELEKHIRPRKQVAVLSGFPLYLAEYFGIAWLTDLLQE